MTAPTPEDRLREAGYIPATHPLRVAFDKALCDFADGVSDASVVFYAQERIEVEVANRLCTALLAVVEADVAKMEQPEAQTFTGQLTNTAYNRAITDARAVIRARQET